MLLLVSTVGSLFVPTSIMSMGRDEVACSRRAEFALSPTLGDFFPGVDVNPAFFLDERGVDSNGSFLLMERFVGVRKTGSLTKLFFFVRLEDAPWLFFESLSRVEPDPVRLNVGAVPLPVGSARSPPAPKLLRKSLTDSLLFKHLALSVSALSVSTSWALNISAVLPRLVTLLVGWRLFWPEELSPIDLSLPRLDDRLIPVSGFCIALMLMDSLSVGPS
jgi:hypothetical protein